MKLNSVIWQTAVNAMDVRYIHRFLMSMNVLLPKNGAEDSLLTLAGSSAAVLQMQEEKCSKGEEAAAGSQEEEYNADSNSIRLTCGGSP